MVSSAPYFEQGNTPADTPPDPDFFFDNCLDSIDLVSDQAKTARDAAVAKGLEYAAYELGVSVFFNNAGAEIFYSAGQPASR